MTSNDDTCCSCSRQEDLHDLDARMTELEDRLDDMTADQPVTKLEDMQRRVDVLQDALDATQTTLEDANAQLADARRSERKLRDQVAKTQALLDLQQNATLQAQDQLQAELDGAQALRDELGARDSEGFPDFVRRLATERNGAEAQRDDVKYPKALEQEADDLHDKVLQLREGQRILERGLRDSMATYMPLVLATKALLSDPRDPDLETDARRAVRDAEAWLEGLPSERRDAAAARVHLCPDCAVPTREGLNDAEDGRQCPKVQGATMTTRKEREAKYGVLHWRVVQDDLHLALQLYVDHLERQVEAARKASDTTVYEGRLFRGDAAREQVVAELKGLLENSPPSSMPHPALEAKLNELDARQRNEDAADVVRRLRDGDMLVVDQDDTATLQAIADHVQALKDDPHLGKPVVLDGGSPNPDTLRTTKPIGMDVLKDAAGVDAIDPYHCCNCGAEFSDHRDALPDCDAVPHGLAPGGFLCRACAHELVPDARRSWEGEDDAD